jgi:integrase
MTVKFILKRKKLNSKGEAPVYAQYTHHSKSVLIATGKKIEPRYWDDESGRAKRHENAATLNKFFNTRENQILRVATELEEADNEPTVDRVKAKLTQVKREKLPETELTRSIIFQWKEYIDNKGTSLAPRTLQNQKHSMEALKVFLLEKKKDSISPERFSLTNIMEFERTMRDKEYSPNTIAKYKKNFKAFLKFYVRLGGNLGFNLEDLRYKESPGIKVSLTQDELDKLEGFPLKDRKAEIRDLFVLQCYTGLRISDLKRLDQNITGNKIKIIAQKTGAEIEIPISPKIRQILERYNYSLPKVPDQKINEGIKDILKDACPDSTIQIKENKKFKTVPKWEVISSHDSIRTFITLSSERGMSVPSIARITGKSVQVLLKHYLNDSQRIAEQEFEKAWGTSPLKIAK